METDPLQTDSQILYDRIASFHGHRCPGIAYGLRVSLAGLARMESKFITPLIIHSDTRRCAIDAIQVVTGCTLGNGKLKISGEDNHIFTFVHENENKGWRINIKRIEVEETAEEAEAASLHADGNCSPLVLERMAQRLEKKIIAILNAPENEVLDIEFVNGILPDSI